MIFLKKFTVIPGLLCLLAHAAIAQKGSNELQIISDMILPDDQDKIGFGGSVKYLHGIGRSAQVTLTAGLFLFASQNSQPVASTTRLIPFLIGYKQDIGHVYFEPQVGFGELGGRINLLQGDYSRVSVAAFFWAFGVGYCYKRMDIGVRFQKIQGVEGSDAGIWHDRSFSLIGLHLGFYLVK